MLKRAARRFYCRCDFVDGRLQLRARDHGPMVDLMRARGLDGGLRAPEFQSVDIRPLPHSPAT